MTSLPPLPAHLLTPLDSVLTDIRFRLVTLSDCQPLHIACFPEKPFIQFRSHCHHLLEWQDDGRCYWLVGINKTGQINASGQLVLYPHGAELANLSVIPTRRSEGIGTALIGVLTAVARHLQLPSLEISVAVSNTRALALYQRLGFTEDRRLQLPHDKSVIILHKDL